MSLSYMASDIRGYQKILERCTCWPEFKQLTFRVYHAHVHMRARARAHTHTHTHTHRVRWVGWFLCNLRNSTSFSYCFLRNPNKIPFALFYMCYFLRLQFSFQCMMWYSVVKTTSRFFLVKELLLCLIWGFFFNTYDKILNYLTYFPSLFPIPPPLHGSSHEPNLVFFHSIL